MADASSPSALGLRFAYRSDPGRVRANNEDLPLIDAERGVFGVIDGVGGHAAGELAAAIAHDVILQRLARPLGTPAERVREAIAIANNEIFRRASESADLRGMTCVATLAVVAEGMLTIGHVGDSRLYKLRADGIQKLTRDHSPVGEREDAREISETDAMRHPRRHEVFRDVGSAYRDKDEEEYVDVVHEPIERDCAILLCTDGLSDMLPSPTIDRIVRRHAGNPDAVAEALVAAANQAGGRDNVTVVYVEGPDFAGAARAARHPRALPTASTGGSPSRLASSGGARRLGRWAWRSRTTWFALGAMTGVVGALLLVWRMPATRAVTNRTLVVGPSGAGMFRTIGDALRTAGAGDTVRVEPGVYPERVVVPDGVHLVARVPASVTLTRMAGTDGEWAAITAVGDLGGRIYGIRVESTATLPIDVGIRAAGQSRTIELAEIAGPMQAGIELLQGAALTVHGGHFAVEGPALTAGQRSQATVTRSVFLRSGRPLVPPVSLAPSAQATLKGNLFAGFGAEIVKGAPAAERQQIAADNVIVTAEPPRPR
ncbi:MAG TPA: protein phosphatase 2C domain-containing protein [Vicinamibacterales bacterium]|nr:protein phosphatase 2C domain-containing protein [Vicinamibacterales bacterium]